MFTLAQALDLAVKYRQAGDLQQAEQLCRQVLQANPLDSMAWHLLGSIALQASRFDLAIEYLLQAVRLRPDFAAAHNLLGIALVQTGRLEDAIASYRQALLLAPSFAQAHTNLGNALRQQGKLEEAVASCREAIRLQPDFAGAHNNLGVACLAAGKREEAVASHQQALRLEPGFAEAHYNLGNALSEQGKRAEAAASYQQALRLRPDYAEAYTGLGTVLGEQGRLEEAAASFEQALRLQPHDAAVHNNLGSVLAKQGKQHEAVASFQEAIRCNPEHAEAHQNLGIQWLLQGNFEQGLPEYEWRWKVWKYPAQLTLQWWHGSPLEGKTILVSAEQGLGDMLQFIRYARLLKAQGAKVIVACQPALLGVLAGCAGIDQLFALGEPLPAFDVQAPLLTLPRWCGTTLATVPAPSPYLLADRDRVNRWRERLAALSGFKVGICWQGSPGHKHDRRRSVPLAQFAPLAAVAGVRLVSLQRGNGTEQLTALAGPWAITDWPGRAEESAEAWVDSAALVRALDLVISVNTAVVHLAGALAVPVWVALPFHPDWRWLLERENSPWYPTVRLFRQSTPGDWDGVITRMATELGRLVCPSRARSAAE